MVVLIIVQFRVSFSAFVASKHCSAGIIIGSDGRGHSTAKGLLVDVHEARDIYKLTDMTYMVCIASPGEFECLLNDVRAFLVGMQPYTKVKCEALPTSGIARVVHKMIREVYPKGNKKKNLFIMYVLDVHVLTILKISTVHATVLGYSSEMHQYQLFEILPSGTLIEQDLVCAGGGSDCILGLLEAQLLNKGKSRLGGTISSVVNEDVEMFKLIGFDGSGDDQDDNDDDDDDDDEGDVLTRRAKIIRHAVQIAMMSDHRSGGKEKILRFTKEEGLIRL